MSRMEVCPYSYFRCCGYFQGPWVFIYYNRWLLSESHKNYFKDCCLTTSQHTIPIFTSSWLNEMAILSKACKPDWITQLSKTWLYQYLSSSFKFCWIFLWINSPDILALCETNLKDSSDSDNFWVRGYLPLIWKDSVTHIHDLAVYVKDMDFLLHETSLKKIHRTLIYVSDWLYFIHCLASFYCIDHFLLLCAQFLCYFM